MTKLEKEKRCKTPQQPTILLCQFADPELQITQQNIQGTSSFCLGRIALEQSLTLENLLKAAPAMESTDEQTTEMEKQQSHAVDYGRNKATLDQWKENYRGPESVDFATMGVVCVLKVTHIKELALLEVAK